MLTARCSRVDTRAVTGTTAHSTIRVDNKLMVREIRITRFTTQPEIGWKRNSIMDSTTFDTVTRNLGTLNTQNPIVSRRTALRSLVAGALAVAGGSAALETEARKGRKHKKQSRKLRPGDFCKNDKQCRNTNDYICGRPRIFSEERVCCGALDALCDETGKGGQRCCYGYLCASGRCIVV